MFQSNVVLDVENSLGTVDVSIYNCMGERVYQDKINLKKGISKFIVPPSGLLEIGKKER